MNEDLWSAGAPGSFAAGSYLSKDFAEVSCTPLTAGSRSVFAIPKRIAGAQYLLTWMHHASPLFAHSVQNLWRTHCKQTPTSPLLMINRLALCLLNQLGWFFPLFSCMLSCAVAMCNSYGSWGVRCKPQMCSFPVPQLNYCSQPKQGFHRVDLSFAHWVEYMTFYELASKLIVPASHYYCWNLRAQ